MVRKYHSFVDSSDLTNKDKSYNSEVEIHTILGKIMPFWLLCYESEAILSKTFHPGNRDGMFM